MPIWKTSELWSGRPGSPCRKATKVRPASSQPSSSRSTALPPLRNVSTDDGAVDDLHTTSCPVTQHPDEVFSVNSYSNCDAFQAALNGHGAAAAVVGGTLGSQRAPCCLTPRSDCLTPRSESRSSACCSVARAHTYTVQYIGIANGELGILSQKQKLTVPVTAPGTGSGPMPADSAPAMHRHSRASRATTAAVRRTSAHAASAAAASSNPSPGQLPAPAPVAGVSRPPLPHTRRVSSARPASSASARETLQPRPNPFLYDGAAVAAAGVAAAASAASAVAADEATPASTAATAAEALTDESPDDDSAASAPVRPPTLAHIVDDAYGQVKVITKCFFSRGLHSRAAPHDRHVRRNLPAGPEVRDMELLSKALPGCFGHRAPSAGGFPGWKLTTPAANATTAAPRRTYSGSGPGLGARGGTQQRASSAQPMTMTSPRALGRIGPDAVAAAAAAAVAAVAEAAAAAVVSSTAAGHRKTAWTGPGVGSGNGAASDRWPTSAAVLAAAAAGSGGGEDSVSRGSNVTPSVSELPDQQMAFAGKGKAFLTCDV